MNAAPGNLDSQLLEPDSSTHTGGDDWEDISDDDENASEAGWDTSHPIDHQATVDDDWEDISDEESNGQDDARL